MFVWCRCTKEFKQLIENTVHKNLILFWRHLILSQETNQHLETQFSKFLSLELTQRPDSYSMERPQPRLPQ